VREKGLSETLKWLFVGEIPMLFAARNVGRQLNVEMWLDPSLLFDALNLKPYCKEKSHLSKYVA